MKNGMTLPELATEVQRQQNAKRDFVADTRHLTPVVSENHFRLSVGDDPFEISELAHRQIGDTLDIPRKYYQRLLDVAPDLWITNLNHWFQQTPSQRMVRTLDGGARAFLSNRYRRLDNFDLANAVLPLFAEAQMEVISANVSERYFHLKAIFPRVEAEVAVGDVVRSGVSIKNSEVGLSRLSVAPMVERLVCSNGMIIDDYATARQHVGRRIDTDDPISELYSDETLAADDKALWLKVKDTVRAAMTPEKFDLVVGKLKAAKQNALPAPVKAIEQLQNRHALTEPEGEGVLAHLISGGELNQFGMVQAISATSQSVNDYDRATELEQLSGKILTLPPPDWNAIAQPQ